jgi:hypothetical protein
VARVKPRSALDRIRSMHHIVTAAAVHMKIDEARQHDGTIRIAHTRGIRWGSLDALDAAMGSELDAAGDEALRREDMAVDGGHGLPSIA